MITAAKESLKSLNKNDISEIKVMKKPPTDVVLVLESLCVIQNIKPIQVPGKNFGEKVNDYWEASRNMISDPAHFLDKLIKFDIKKMTEALIRKIQPYIENPKFQPQKIIKVPNNFFIVYIFNIIPNYPYQIFIGI